MKNKVFIIGLLLSTTFCLNTTAQESSTEANPKWFYIQVKGTNSYTADRVLTEMADGQVLGRPLAAGDMTEIGKQLWRFEIPSGIQGYRVINKHSNKQLTVVYHAETLQRRLAVADVPTLYWRNEGASSYKKWKIISEPDFGGAGQVYLEQTPYNGYAYRLVASDNATTDNDLFRFVRNEIPIISSDTLIVWMNIRNSKTGKYLTDAVSSSPGKNFTLESDNSVLSQHWKMISKENGNVELINRATGNIISSETNLNKYYYVDYTTDPAQSAGWKFQAVSGATGQYAIFSTDADGVTSYWNATTDGQSPDAYSPGKAANSTYAWVFSWAEVLTGISRPDFSQDGVRIYSENRRIYVEGADEYTVTAISGLPVRKNLELPLGIYLVTVKGKTKKILVK